MHADSRHTVAPVPNVTPMIDVMLVLLCIFMIVTPALSAGVDAEPPQGEHLRPHPDDGGDHTLAIDASGRLYLDRRGITAAELPKALAGLVPASASDRILFVRAHRTLDFGTIRAALDVASASGVAVVGLVAEEPPR